MGKTFVGAVNIIHDEVCCKVNNQIIVKSTGTVATSNAQKMFDAGLITRSGEFVNLTVEGMKMYRAVVNPRTRKKATDFMTKHGEMVAFGKSFVAADGEKLSRYAGQYLIFEGMMVHVGDGRYLAETIKIEVSGDIYPAVKAFVEMLERARS